MDEEHQSKHDEHDRQSAYSKAQLEEEIAKRGRPEIVLLCDWAPENSKAPITMHQNPLVVQELNGVAAKDVHIRDIVLSKGTASYEVVSLVPAHSKVPSICTIGQQNTSYAMWDLRVLIRHSFEGCAEIKVPIVVDYEDMRGTRWESINELRYNTFLAIGQVHHKNTRRKV